jgi:hypothetical protein
LADDALLQKKPIEVVESLSRFGQVTGTIPLQSADIALDNGVIELADGIALLVQPAAKRVPHAHVALDTTRSIALLVKVMGEVIEVGSQRAAPQSGDDVLPNKEMVEHMPLLFSMV